MYRKVFIALFTLCVMCASPLSTRASDAESPGKPVEKTLVNTDKKGLALQGYDPVGYFTDNKPVKGDKKFTSVFRGATYRFATAEHKSMFEADPVQFEPQFGGFCGYAASINKVSPISVKYFQIIDGRLILQHNRKAWNLWNKDVDGNLKKADVNWPGLEAEHGKPTE